MTLTPRDIAHPLGTIHVGQYPPDLTGRPWVSFDTETTGLNAYAEDFRIRLFQVGVQGEAWVFEPDATTVRRVMSLPQLWAHNRVFDMIALEAKLGLSFDNTSSNTFDTQTLAKILDPRPRMKGGAGHSLEEASSHYLGIGSKRDALSGLVAAGRKYGLTKDRIYAEIPEDDDEYLRYAGQDVLLTSLLAEKLVSEIRRRGLEKLARYEHDLAVRLAYMQRVGVRVDVPYLRAAREAYDARSADGEAAIEAAGIKPTASGRASTAAASIKAWAVDRGAKLTVRTPKHAQEDCDCEDLKHYAMNAQQLHLLAVEPGEVGKLARTVRATKQAAHYVEYLDRYMEHLGSDGRVHPSVNPMAAATGRMSITNPALQQLPRDEPMLRGSLVPDDGCVFVSIDYSSIEMRVAAGLSEDEVMIQDIINGADMHAVAAEALYGPGFTDDQRQRAKSVSLGRAYGGGPKGILESMANVNPVGLPRFSDVKRAISAFDGRYRGFAAWMSTMASRADRDGGIVTAFGRPLKVSHGYQAVAYACQSAARDIMAGAIDRCWDAGIGENIRLVVHDELVFEFPAGDAERLTGVASRAMETSIGGVPITVKAGGPTERWSK